MTQNSAQSALLLIDIQEGFNDPSWGRRNNPEFEKNIAQVLNLWREKSWPIIHIQHHSHEEKSPLRAELAGVQFMKCAKPQREEKVFIKHVHSAFIGTDLQKYLLNENIQNLVITGMTADHCVSTTARMAHDLGFAVTIPENCVATFPRQSLIGHWIPADQIQEAALASLHQEFAQVIPAITPAFFD